MTTTGYKNLDELFTDANDRASSDPVQITIRRLMSHFGAAGRGAKVVKTIGDRLAQENLTTKPDFTLGYIDTTVTLVRAPSGTAVEPADSFQELFLRVNTLRCAKKTVTTVTPNHTIQRAQTLMATNEFSQLAVCSTLRSEPRLVSWESIGRASARGTMTEVRQAAVAALSVRPSDDLLPLLSRIATDGVVFVRTDNVLTGIITAADITEEFENLAGPFFLIGDIERGLRVAVDSTFTPDELLAVREPEDRREVTTSEDLTFGELQRLIDIPGNWDRLNWDLDRVIFLERIDEVRKIRNSFMHFSSDLPSDEDVNKLRLTARLLQSMTQQR